MGGSITIFVVVDLPDPVGSGNPFTQPFGMWGPVCLSRCGACSSRSAVQ